MDVLDWILGHWVELSAVAGGIWTVVSTVVALTPTKADDEFLAALAQRFSFLSSRNVPGVFKLPGTRPAADSPPRGNGGAPFLVLLLVAGGAAPNLQACDASAYTMHAVTAEGLHGALDVVRSTILAHREAFLREAAGVEREDGESDEAYRARREAAVRDSALAWDARYGEWIAGHATGARAVNAYTSAAYAGVRGQAGAPGELTRIGLEALRAVANLVETLRRAGHDVPELPEAWAEFLGADALGGA